MSSVNVDSTTSVMPAMPVAIPAPNFGTVALILLTLAAAVFGISLPNANMSAGFEGQSVQLTAP